MADDETNLHREKKLIDERDELPTDANPSDDAAPGVTVPTVPDVSKDQKAPYANRQPHPPHVPQR